MHGRLGQRQPVAHKRYKMHPQGFEFLPLAAVQSSLKTVSDQLRVVGIRLAAYSADDIFVPAS